MDLELECYLNYSTNSNDMKDDATIDKYTKNLLEINVNLRSQLENLYKLLKIKLKFENCERLDKLLDELEILKSGLSLSMQKQTVIVSK